jgi:integrase
LKQYAVVYSNSKIHYLGLYGSPESKTAYSRFVAETRIDPIFAPPQEGEKITVSDLVAAFLDHVKPTLDDSTFGHYRTLVADFLLKLYGNDTVVDDFKPRSLKLVRSEMIQSQRFCRNTINVYTRRIVSIFGWGVSEELAPETTWRALKSVKPLKKGYHGTYDNPEREEVPDHIIVQTLPFMPKTLATMVQVQRLTGMRPSEVCKMRVGDIDKTRDPELWYYAPESHKTEKHIGKKDIPLGKPEQVLIAPYLEGKEPEAAVFSPRTAQEERNIEKRANRKTKISPSQAARDKARASKPTRYNEFYDKRSYWRAVNHAIVRGNKILPEGKKIPHWFPYQIRHAAGTETERQTGSLDKAQALLGHKTPNVTRRYAKAQLTIAEEMARNRQNPFDNPPETAGKPAE